MSDDLYCVNGHPWADNEARWGAGWRQCKTCHREANKKAYRKKRRELQEARRKEQESQ